MKLWFLDNEHTDYIVMSETETGAWLKLARVGILRPDAAEIVDDEGQIVGQAAYNGMFEVPNGYTVDNPHDLRFVL